MSSDDGSEPSQDSPVLTEEQEAFIKECDEEFCERYSENDPDYKKLKEDGVGNPPVISPWYSRQRRNYDWSNHSHGDSHRHRDYNNRRDHFHSHRRDNYHSHRRDNYRGNRRDNYHSNRFRSNYDNRSRPY